MKLGQIATTIARPDRGYGGTYNYFDPDNFISMTALIYSGEPFLQEQVGVSLRCTAILDDDLLLSSQSASSANW